MYHKAQIRRRRTLQNRSAAVLGKITVKLIVGKSACLAETYPGHVPINFPSVDASVEKVPDMTNFHCGKTLDREAKESEGFVSLFGSDIPKRSRKELPEGKRGLILILLIVKLLLAEYVERQ